MISGQHIFVRCANCGFNRHINNKDSLCLSCTGESGFVVKIPKTYFHGPMTKTQERHRFSEDCAEYWHQKEYEFFGMQGR